MGWQCVIPLPLQRRPRREPLLLWPMGMAKPLLLLLLLWLVLRQNPPCASRASVLVV